MSISSVGCFQRATFVAAAIILCGTIDFNQLTHAQEIRANGIGFVDYKYPREYRKGEFLPAVVFRTAEGASYLITNRLVSPKYYRLCFIEASKLTIIPSGDWLNEPTSFAGIFGPEICSYYIPYEEIDDDARSMFDKMAVNEKDFAPAQVGLAVKTLGQTLNLYTAGQDAAGVIAASGHTAYGGLSARHEIDSRVIDYNLILPDAKSAPMSWVQLDQQPNDGKPTFVGLVLNRLINKEGDCFLDIEDLKLICSDDLIGSMIQRMRDPPALSGASKSGLAYDLRPAPVSDARKTTRDRSRFEGFFSYRRETVEPKDIGVACNLVQANEKMYLLIEATHATRLTAQSKACFRIASDVKTITVGDYFLWSADQYITIDDSLVALPARHDQPLPAPIGTAAHQLEQAIDAEEDLEAIFGTSHTDGMVRRRIEESLVFYLDISFTQEDYGLKPVPSFNAGIYPTILFGVKDNRPRLFGVLSFNKRTQEPTIYSANELRSFLSKQ